MITLRRPAGADRRTFHIVAAAFTPMNPDRTVNLDAIPAHLELLGRQGVGTVFVNGSTGEGPLLTLAERRLLAERWVKEAAGEFSVIVHVGHSSPDEAAGLARHAAQIGADGISAVGPFYFRPGTTEELLWSCAIVAGAAPQLPFFYYHIPTQTGVAVAMPSFLDAATATIPNFAGIKFTNEDLNAFARCVEQSRPGQEIFYGRDEILLAALAMGAGGAIGTTYTFMAGVFQSLVENFEAGNLAAARQAQRLARTVIDIAHTFGGFPAFKAIASWAGGDLGPLRAPLPTLTADQEHSLRGQLESAGVLGLVDGSARAFRSRGVSPSTRP